MAGTPYQIGNGSVSVARGKDTSASFSLKRDCPRSGKNCLCRFDNRPVCNQPVNEAKRNERKLPHIASRPRTEQKFLPYQEIEALGPQRPISFAMHRDKGWCWESSAFEPRPDSTLEQFGFDDQAGRKPGNSLCRTDFGKLHQQHRGNANHREQALRPGKMRPGSHRKPSGFSRIWQRKPDGVSNVGCKNGLPPAQATNVEGQPVAEHFSPAFGGFRRMRDEVLQATIRACQDICQGRQV